MYNSKRMVEKIKNLHQNQIVKELMDVRVLGMIVFAVIVLFVSWKGVDVIERNYTLHQQIARKQQENKLEELENKNIALENEYYKTDQYLELQARKNFGKAAPGETLVLVPEEVALKHAEDFGENDKPAKPEADKPFYQENFEAWINFFLHRPNNDS